MENTLLLGNGFSRTLFRNMPSWQSLFSNNEESIINEFTLLYELHLFNNTEEGDTFGYQRDKESTEEKVKNKLLNKIQKKINRDNLQENILNTCKIAELLKKNNINNIITTNL